MVKSLSEKGQRKAQETPMLCESKKRASKQFGKRIDTPQINLCICIQDVTTSFH